MSSALAETRLVTLGSLLDDKFRVHREIGRGGMAVVYEAENIDIGKRVAVKVLSAELAQSKVVTERFMREARAAAKIRSPYICDVYDVGTFEGRPFLVMELLEGESLYDRLARERRLTGDEVVRIATETALGLEQAHQSNIVHRDLKPENIFLTVSGSGEQRTKIVDFGLAKFYEPNLEGGENARLTKEGALFGTPAYMSPEQARAHGAIDYRADLWALGCIVYEMAVGRTVWNVDQGVAMILAQIASGPLPTPSRLCPDLPVSFDHWFFKALSRDPAQRFSSAQEMAAALKGALASEPSSARLPVASAEALVPVVDSTEARPRAASRAQRIRRHAPWGWLAAGGLLVLGAGLGVFWAGIESPRDLLRLVGIHSEPAPVEDAPFAQVLGRAQEQLASGDIEGALQSFDTAFADGEHKAARSLRSHARAVYAKLAENTCRVTALGHPRPFDVRTESSGPTIAQSPPGPLLAAWAAKYEEGKQRAVFAAQLDPMLRRVSAARLVTPEAVDAQNPQVVPGKSGFLLVYTDTDGKRSVVQARLLSPSGRLRGKPFRVSGEDAQLAYDPSLARDEDGTYWIAYTQATEPSVHDLYVRHLSDSLEALTGPVQLTAFTANSKFRSSPQLSSLSVHKGMVAIAFVVQQGKDRHIEQLAVPIEAIGKEPLRPVGPDSDDRVLGSLIGLSERTDEGAEPRLACFAGGCLAVWADAVGGSQAAFTTKDGRELAWKRGFSAEGLNPTVGAGEKGAAVAWYEGRRVRLAQVSETGVGGATTVGRINGQHPTPRVVAGLEPGRWLVAWRNYEASVTEPFVARVDCIEPPASSK